MFNTTEFRQHFPQLQRQVQGRPLVYFDNAASSLKPKEVADTIYSFYLNDVANIHRGAHTLSREGTEKFEGVRQLTQNFIRARSASEIVFTRGVTESVNLITYTYGLENLKKGDVILLTSFEHHSNLVPWLRLSQKTGATIEVLPFDENGQITATELDRAFAKKVKFVSLLLYSNVTGIRLDVESVLPRAKAAGALTLVDAAQGMLHEALDVQKLDCDFLTFSGHKMLAPYGVGVLYIRKEVGEQLPPFHGGGSMISLVSWDKIVYQEPPHKFEAGTPSIPDVLGLGTAIEFIQKYELRDWISHGKELMQALREGLGGFSKVRLLGSQRKDVRRADILSFSYEGAHASDVGEILDHMGIAVRAGHHCAQPLMAELGLSGTVRVSLAPYNTLGEVNVFLQAMNKVKELL